MKQSMIITDMVARPPAPRNTPAGNGSDPGASFGSTLDEQMNGGSNRTDTRPAHDAAAIPKEPAPSDTDPASTPHRSASGDVRGEQTAPEADAPEASSQTLVAEAEAGAGASLEPAAVPLPVVMPRDLISRGEPAAGSMTEGSRGEPDRTVPGALLPEVEAVERAASASASAAMNPMQSPGAPVSPAPLAMTSAVPGALQPVAMPARPVQEGTIAAAAAAVPAAGDGIRSDAVTPARSVAPAAAGLQGAQAAGAGAADAFSDTESSLARRSQDGSVLSSARPGEGGSGFAQALAATAPARGETTTSLAMPRPLPALETPMGSSQWGSGLSSRIAFGISAGVTSATLALNPQELGPVNIQLNVVDDEATVQFSSQHAAVRDAIESAMPRLREALAEEGIRLGEVAIDTGAGASRDDARSDEAGEGSDPEGAEPESTAEMEMARPASLSSGLVDTFA